MQLTVCRDGNKTILEYTVIFGKSEIILTGSKQKHILFYLMASSFSLQQFYRGLEYFHHR